MPTTRSNAAEEDFVFGGGIKPPVYERPFSVQSSEKCYKEYVEYERNVKLSNHGQTVQRPLLTLSQLLPASVRWCLADLFFEEQGDDELAESDLRRGLAQHGECWTGAEVHPGTAVAEVERILVMRSEPTAVARIDAAQERLEEYFENPSAARLFREKRKYISGSARIITEALVRGLTPPEFKENVVARLKVSGSWKDDPKKVFALIRAEAITWRVVEKADEQRRSRKKNVSGGNIGAAQSTAPVQRQKNGNKLTCFTCGELGHKSYACPKAGNSSPADSRGSKGDAGKSDTRQEDKQQRFSGAPQAKGTPAARGGAQAKSGASQGVSVTGRAAVPVGEDGSAQGGGTSDGLPPDPVIALKGPGAATPSPPIISGWRAVSSSTVSAILSDGVEIEPRELSCMVDLSVSDAVNPKVTPMKAVLDSGAGLSTITKCLLKKLEDSNPTIPVVEAMQQEHKLRVVDGRELFVTEKTCQVDVAVHTGWGPKVVRSQRFAVMPGTDDVLIIGSPMLKRLGIDVYRDMEESARKDREAYIEGLGSGDATVVRSAFTNGESLVAETNLPDTEIPFAGDKAGKDSMVAGAVPKTVLFEEQCCNEKDIMGASTQGANFPWCKVGTSSQNRVDENPVELGDVAGGFASYRDGIT